MDAFVERGEVVLPHQAGHSRAHVFCAGSDALRLEVETCAESAASARDDDRTECRVGIDRCDDLLEFADHRRRDRV